MKHLFYLSFMLLITTISCKDTKKPVEKKVTKPEIAQSIKDEEAYKLMEQKCFICHFPVPDKSRKNEMIAPPMLRVQEHYKPAYPNKEDFITAIKSWVKEPTEEKIQMPGASRKFKIMPYLPYTDQEITLIAEILYNIDFESEFKGNYSGGHHGEKQELQLNNGNKWKLDKEAIVHVKSMITKLNSFKSDDVKDYQELGKENFTLAKTLILQKDLEGKKLEQLQAFFHDIEEDIHNLIQAKTVEEGQKQQEIIKGKFAHFFEFFE